MKVGKNSRYWRHRYRFLVGIATLSLGLYAWAQYTTLPFKECSAVIRVTNHLQDKTLRRILLLKIESDKGNEFTALLNGSFYDEDTRYSVDRIVTGTYKRQGKGYLFQFTGNMLKPKDSVTKDYLNQRLPTGGDKEIFRIEKIDHHNILFSSNYAPLFVRAVAD